MSRTPLAGAEGSVAGDVSLAGLGLAPEAAASLRAEVTCVVTCFGSVSWSDGPGAMLATHRDGMANVLAFARTCATVPRVVHVSSILALGRPPGVVTNDVFDVGQEFRNWYEYGKFLSERELRVQDDVPWTILRLGPVLGALADGTSARDDGLLAVLPFLLRGYPVHLAGGGEFPCYVCDVHGAAEVVRLATRAGAAGATWTWFDPRLPSLACVLTSVCDAWGVTPRIVTAPPLGTVTRLAARRLGVPAQLLDYAKPWMDIDPAVLDAFEPGVARCRDGYLTETGRALRASVAVA